MVDQLINNNTKNIQREAYKRNAYQQDGTHFSFYLIHKILNIYLI